MSANISISEQFLRSLLIDFWNETLEVATTPRGLVFTMPVSYPDGWQVILELCPKTPKSYLLNDRGKTLSWLSGQGLNIHTPAIQARLRQLCEEHSISEENGVLQRWLTLPLNPTEIHVFAEGLAAITRLDFFNEHRSVEENVAEVTVNRVFRDVGLEPQRNHKLSITSERKVAVDYFVQSRRPLAVKLIKTHTDLTGAMEKWGFRWDELRKAYSDLAPVMLYDRNTQDIGSYERHIGETKCELFCGYDETDRIHRVLTSVR